MVERPGRGIGFVGHIGKNGGAGFLVEISYHDDLNVLQGLGLASESPFERREWFTLLAEEGGLQPFLVLARDGAEACALPLMRRGRALVPLANWYSFTWRHLATSAAASRRLLPEIARDLAGRRHSDVTLWPLAGEGAVAAQLHDAFAAAGWWTALEQCDVNHSLCVGDRDFAAYLASRPGQLRTTIARKAKRNECTISVSFSDDEWDIYEEIYERSWKPEEGKPAMLRRFARAEGAAGRLRLGIARHEGKPVAAQFWTVENGTAFIHKLAHLDEARPLSSGTVLTAALMEHAIDRDRVTEVDFGTGDDPYKRDWMDEVRARYRLTCLKRGDLRNWGAVSRRMLRSASRSSQA